MFCLTEYVLKNRIQPTRPAEALVRMEEALAGAAPVELKQKQHAVRAAFAVAEGVDAVPVTDGEQPLFTWRTKA